MASYNKFNNFVQALGTAGISLSTAAYKVLLTNTAPVATNSVYSDISAAQVANGNGYTTGGSTATYTSWSNSSGTSKLILQDVVFTATGAVGPFRYAVLYDATSTTLIGWWDYGSSISLANADTFTVDFDQSGGIFTLV